MSEQGTPILQIKNLGLKVGEKTILENCNLSLQRGELKVLIGPSGAGKSTFLQCINLLQNPDTAQIFLEGAEIPRHNKKALCSYRSQVGMIFQDFKLFDHLTALDNV
ncbi:MAG: amino acid ABC transporter ATP-binding protein, partial [Desulfovibrio sp.]|nr:amino acid ABC transporter ATP-binding protein [Desulfovibrio sp.]